MSLTEDPTGTVTPIKAVPVRHPGRWVAAAVIGVLAAMLIHAVLTEPGFEWASFGKYLFNGAILKGALTTIELTVLAMAVGIAGGIMLAVMRLSANPVLTATSILYIWFFRGTPVLVQVVLWYSLASLFPHLSIGIPFGPELGTASTNSLISKFTAAVLGLGLNEAAYMAEIVRAGILSVDEGQSEAASALGMPNGLIMRRVVLPQAMRVIVPPTGNETISMLKTSSIVVYIALVELFTSAQNIINATFKTIPLLLVACFWYLVMTSILTIGQGYLERHFGRGSSRIDPTGGVLERIWNGLRFGRPRMSGYEQATTGLGYHT
jgi:polar amino acid transport system permease protein